MHHEMIPIGVPEGFGEGSNTNSLGRIIHESDESKQDKKNKEENDDHNNYSLRE